MDAGVFEFIWRRVEGEECTDAFEAWLKYGGQVGMIHTKLGQMRQYKHLKPLNKIDCNSEQCSCFITLDS